MRYAANEDLRPKEKKKISTRGSKHVTRESFEIERPEPEKGLLLEQK